MRIVVCMATVVACLVAPCVALGDLSTLGGSAGSPLEDQLVVPSAEGLLEGQGVREAEEVRLNSPEAVVAREESQTKYGGLGSVEAGTLLGEAYPAVVDRSGGGPPQLPEGGKLAGFIGADAAQVGLGGGSRGVVESSAPMAAESAPGRWSAVNLSLSESVSGFALANPAVGLRIPKLLQDGVSLSDSGVSLSMADGSGGSVGAGEGRIVGSVVFYGGVGVGSDVDVVVKPDTGGFSEDAFLRSAASPELLYYRVGLPQGASLVAANDGSGAVNVLEGGTVVASIAAPRATDAAGRTVGVSMSVEGSLLALKVVKGGGGYQYPILVDPEVKDFWLTKEGKHTTNWHFTRSEGAAEFLGGEKGPYENIYAGAHHTEHEWGALEYTTQGESRIGYMNIEKAYIKDAGARVENLMEIASNKGVLEGKSVLPEQNERGEIWNFVCTPEPTCREGKGNLGTANNSAEYFETATHAGEGVSGEFSVAQSAVYITQEKGPEVSVDSSHETVGGKKNVLYGAGSWLGPKSGAFEIHAKDPGVGVSYFHMNAGHGLSGFAETKNYIESQECTGGVQCFPEVNKSYVYSSTLPDGEDEIESYVKDAMGLEADVYPPAKLKVDGTAPHAITLSGLPSNHELSDGQHISLKASAKDGEGETPSSGVASIALAMDGQEVASPAKGCSPGPCTANGEWTLSAESYAAGPYTLEVVATDNAGNVASETYQVTIYHAEGVSAGPASVNPVTGEVSLTATDVSVGVPDGALTVARSYRSRHVAQGAEGPLGPQWNLSLAAQQSLLRVSGGMVLTGSSGGQVAFTSKGKGEFTSPAGDTGLILLEKTGEKGTYFTLSQNGSVTTFETPSGASNVWMPSSIEGPNGTNATLYKFKVSGGLIEPTEELAPVPAGVTCGKEISELKEGCRALKFEYATKTEAKGEKASEWNEYNGRLAKVKYIAWNASKTKVESVVAEYAYDAKGRLRAEWDPEVKPTPLKTTYGYDTEGHVTALSTAGHEPTLLEQGTIPNDASPGRLLAVAVPSASAALGSGEAPVNTEALALSSTKPAVGTKISVNLTSEKTPGKWSASPLAFIYQWEDCNSSGKECTSIPGAVNQAYYPVPGDEGHTLVAEAIALNATGATTASSAVTSTVASGAPNTPLPEPPYVGTDAVTTLEYQVPVSGIGAPYEMSSSEVAKWGQADDPSEAMAIFPPDKVMGWPAKEYKRETVYYLDGKDRAVNTAVPTGGIATTEYNPYNDIVRTLTPDNRKKALEETGKTVEASKLLDTENTYEESGSEPGTELLNTVGPRHMVKLVSGAYGKPEERLARQGVHYSYNEGAPAEGGPYHLVTRTETDAETEPVEIGVEEFVSQFDSRVTTTSYNGQEKLGFKLRKPTSVTTSQGGLNLLHTTLYDSSTGNVTETRGPGLPTILREFGSEGSGLSQFKNPVSAAVNKSNNIWIADYNNHRIGEFDSSGNHIYTVGSEEGTGNSEFRNPWGIAVNRTTGNVYVTDYTNDRVSEFSSNRVFIRMFGFGVSDGQEKFEICTTTCRAGRPGAGNGQFNGPTGMAIDSTENVWVVDRKNSRVEEFTSNGEYLGQIAGKKGSGNGELNEPGGLAISGGNLYVVDALNNRVEEFSPAGKYETQFGTKGKGHDQFENPESIATTASENLVVTDTKNSRVEEFAPKGVYLTEFTGGTGASKGQAKEPEGIAVDSKGFIYVIDTGNSRVEKWTPPAGVGNEAAHDTKTVYYTKVANIEYSECGEHPQWANLPCETRPAAQPEIGGLPELPVTKYTYNTWGEPETTTETVGSTTRTKTNTYDAAGRLKTNSITSSAGTSLPTVTDEYNSETGALEKQSTTVEGKTKTITSIYNKLGQIASYTDASENTTTYEYEKEKAARLTKTNDQKGTETYTYNETTGLLAELLYENGATKVPFTATYDTEGNMLTEGYPNGMTAAYTYNSVGKPTALEYKKTTHCIEKCVWFSDTIIPSIHGQWLEQTSTFSHQVYTYDADGRLTEVQNTPVGQGCTTRIYSYDRDTNRTSLTTRDPGAEGKCATTGGKVETHIYDTADRLTDTGIKYNEFGDITTLPEQNAEDPELTSTYYTDNQLASEKQNKQTIGYNLDPTGRTLETISSGEPNNSTIISHYDEQSNTPAWSTNPLTGEWSRNITSIDGGLAAIQNNGETPELQLTNLHGDIVAKAYLSETATELAAKADTSEFGVPTVSAPAKYSWLGAIQLPTELPSGVVSMGARSYVPQIGRFLQPDPIPGGSANAYSYTYGDPVNTADPTGTYVEGAYLQSFNNTENQHAIEREAEREAAARAAAEQAAREAAEAAGLAGPQYEGEEYWEEWEEYEEEEGYEYGSYNGSTGHTEDGVFYRGLEEESSTNSELGSLKLVSQCNADLNGERGGARKTDIANQCPVQSKRGGKGKVPTGPKRPPRQPGKSQGGRGKRRPPRRPPGGRQPKKGWPQNNNSQCEEENSPYGNLCI